MKIGTDDLTPVFPTLLEPDGANGCQDDEFFLVAWKLVATIPGRI